MKDSAHPKNLPWIMWLLRVLSSDSRASDAKLFQDAEDNGLITKTETPLWNVDRNWAKSLPSKISTARDLKTPDDVANFIMAMAELSARCNELSIKESQAKLREAKSTKQLARVFDLIGEWTNKHCLPADPNLDELATVKWIQGCKWNHESLRSVSWLVDHPSRLRLFDRWGLALGVRIAASLNFREFGIWLAKQTDASIVSPALYTLPELAFWGDEDTYADTNAPVRAPRSSTCTHFRSNSAHS